MVVDASLATNICISSIRGGKRKRPFASDDDDDEGASHMQPTVSALQPLSRMQIQTDPLLTAASRVAQEEEQNNSAETAISNGLGKLRRHARNQAHKSLTASSVSPVNARWANPLVVVNILAEETIPAVNGQTFPSASSKATQNTIGREFPISNARQRILTAKSARHMVNGKSEYPCQEESTNDSFSIHCCNIQHRIRTTEMYQGANEDAAIMDLRSFNRAASLSSSASSIRSTNNPESSRLEPTADCLLQELPLNGSHHNKNNTQCYRSDIMLKNSTTNPPSCKSQHGLKRDQNHNTITIHRNLFNTKKRRGVLQSPNPATAADVVTIGSFGMNLLAFMVQLIQQLSYRIPLLLLFALSFQYHYTEASVACETTAFCEYELRPGSKCRDGFCTNPFQKGCLRNYLGEDAIPDLRTCNSDDTTEETCKPSAFDYSEIRIFSQNWETPMFTTWILQIVLSELVQIPVTIESGGSGRTLNFYDAANRFDYATAGYDWEAFHRANAPPIEGGPCPKAWRENPISDEASTDVETSDDSDNWEYQSCAHVITEVWSGQAPTLANLTAEQVIEPAEGTGVVGKLSWYLPKFVAQQDPSLTHWLGLTGASNRRKVAETFKVPTTFGQYCREIVPDNCTNATLFASRAPLDDAEAEKYYVAGVFQGYFRWTPENDCDLNPDTCVGHIADVPCDWSTFVIPQAHHLDIPVVSRGPSEPTNAYTYGQLLDIWAAANATQSPLLFFWWYPDPTYQYYLGTAAEMQAVQLPPPSQECITSRVTPDVRCGNLDLEDRVGDPLGACDSEPHALSKAIVANLYPYLKGAYHPSNRQDANTDESGAGNNGFDSSNQAASDGDNLHKILSHASSANQMNSPTWNPALESPAYDIIKSLSITELQLGEIIDAWESRGLDKWNYDPREAVCEWVVDNFETIQTWIPRTYPRSIQEDAYNHGKKGLFGFALALASVVMCLVLVTSTMTYYWRRRPVLVFAQVGFLYFLLTGLFLVSFASLLVVLEPNDVTCAMQPWLVTLGYTLELVPLIVKVGAIHTMMQAAKKMKRVTLQVRQLYGTVVFFCLLAIVYLSVWTGLDPYVRKDEITLHQDRVTDRGETVVTVSHYCGSGANDLIWRYITLAWQCVLLLSATVLAVQTRNIREDLNESKTLGLMIYSHFVFLGLRVITYFLEDSGTVERNTLEALRSLILSGDVFVALNIYFTPKMWNLYHYDDEYYKAKMSLQRRASMSRQSMKATGNFYSANANMASSFSGVSASAMANTGGSGIFGSLAMEVDSGGSAAQARRQISSKLSSFEFDDDGGTTDGSTSQPRRRRSSKLSAFDIPAFDDDNDGRLKPITEQKPSLENGEDSEGDIEKSGVTRNSVRTHQSINAELLECARKEIRSSITKQVRESLKHHVRPALPLDMSSSEDGDKDDMLEDNMVFNFDEMEPINPGSEEDGFLDSESDEDSQQARINRRKRTAARAEARRAYQAALAEEAEAVMDALQHLQANTLSAPRSSLRSSSRGGKRRSKRGQTKSSQRSFTASERDSVDVLSEASSMQEHASSVVSNHTVSSSLAPKSGAVSPPTSHKERIVSTTSDSSTSPPPQSSPKSGGKQSILNKLKTSLRQEVVDKEESKHYDDDSEQRFKEEYEATAEC